MLWHVELILSVQMNMNFVQFHHGQESLEHKQINKIEMGIRPKFSCKWAAEIIGPYLFFALVQTKMCTYCR